MIEEELKQKARERTPDYMDMIQRAIYASAYVDGSIETTKELQKQLAEAKKIIRQFLDLKNDADSHAEVTFILDVRTKAEAFLKE